MSELPQGWEAALRQALHATAEQHEPGHEGLKRIKARVRHRRPMPLPIAWADVALTKLSLRVPDGFWVAWDKMARELRAASERFLPPARPGSRLYRRLSWLRPAAAMSTAVFIVAAVVYMAVEVPQVIAPAGSVAPSLHTTGPNQRTGANTGPGGRPFTQPGSKPTSYPSASARNANACATPKATPKKTITGAPTSPTSPTSPPASPSPSTSPSTSPTPTPTTSQTAPAGSSPSANPNAATMADIGPIQNYSVTMVTARGSTDRLVTAVPSASPCPTPKPSPTSTVSPTSAKVSPDAAALLALGALGAMLPTSDLPGQID